MTERGTKVDLPACPAWCAGDDAHDPALPDHQQLHIGDLSEHVALILPPGGPVLVALYAEGPPPNDQPPRFTSWTPEAARMLAHELLNAADVAEGLQ